MQVRKSERLQAIEELKRIIKPEDTIFSVLRSVSRSGMSRDISFFVFDKESCQPLMIDYLIAKVFRLPRSKNEGIKIHGCGMDMGYHIVNSLSIVLFCPDKYEHAAAYSLKHRWL